MILKQNVRFVKIGHIQASEVNNALEFRSCENYGCHNCVCFMVLWL